MTLRNLVNKEELKAKLQAEDLENLIKKKEIQRALMKEVAKANEVTEPHPLGYTSHPPQGGSDRIFW